MMKKYNRIKSQQHVRLYKVQFISVPSHMVVSCILSPLSLLLLSAAPTTGESRWLSGNLCSYSMLKVEGSNPRDCALRPLTAGVVSVWIYLFAVGSGRL